MVLFTKIQSCDIVQLLIPRPISTVINHYRYLCSWNKYKLWLIFIMLYYCMPRTVSSVTKELEANHYWNHSAEVNCCYLLLITTREFEESILWQLLNSGEGFKKSFFHNIFSFDTDIFHAWYLLPLSSDDIRKPILSHLPANNSFIWF